MLADLDPAAQVLVAGLVLVIVYIVSRRLSARRRPPRDDRLPGPPQETANDGRSGEADRD